MPSFPRPTDFPEWASGGGADITDPGASAKSQGWVDKQKPPHDWFNYWQNLVYDWFQYIDKKDPQRFSSLKSAFATMSDDEIGIIDEHDPSTNWLTDIPWTFNLDTVTTPSALNAMTCDGEYVFVSYKDGGTEYLMCRDTDGVLIYKITPPYTIEQMHSDGNDLWVTNGADLYKYVRTTGLDSGVTKFTHTATIESVDSTGKYVWVAGGIAHPTLADVSVVDATSSPLTLLFDWFVSSSLLSFKVKARGDFGYAIYPNASQDLRRFNAADGTSLAGVDIDVLDFVILNDALFAAKASGGFDHISLEDLSVISTPHGALIDTNTVNTLAYDGTYLAIEQNDVIYFYLADTMACVGSYAISGTPFPKALVADATSFYYFEKGTNFVLRKQRSPKRAVTVRRCLGTDGYRAPFSQLFIPVPR